MALFVMYENPSRLITYSRKSIVTKKGHYKENNVFS